MEVAAGLIATASFCCPYSRWNRPDNARITSGTDSRNAVGRLMSRSGIFTTKALTASTTAATKMGLSLRLPSAIKAASVTNPTRAAETLSNRSSNMNDSSGPHRAAMPMIAQALGLTLASRKTANGTIGSTQLSATARLKDLLVSATEPIAKATASAEFNILMANTVSPTELPTTIDMNL